MSIYNIAVRYRKPKLQELKRIYFKLLQFHISEMFPINSARCIHAELRLMFGHVRRNIKRSAVFRLQLDHAGCFHYQLISISLVSCQYPLFISSRNVENSCLFNANLSLGVLCLLTASVLNIQISCITLIVYILFSPPKRS